VVVNSISLHKPTFFVNNAAKTNGQHVRSSYSPNANSGAFRMIARVACTAMIALIFCSAASWAQPSPADIPAATFAQLNGFTNARISPDGAS